MVWHIDIDEAGYGPNLGPLVMTSVACRTPEGVTQGDLWKLLKSAVRRPHHKDDGRILVEDSKVLFGQASGIGALEKSVFAFLSPSLSPSPSLTLLVESLSPGSSALRDEHWYTGRTVLPLKATSNDIQVSAQRFAKSCQEASITWGLTRSVIVCAPQFNGFLEQWHSKGAILAAGLVQLLRENLRVLEANSVPVHFLVDKHGGRNQYAAMLQTAFDENMVIAREESAYRSCYNVMDSDIEVAFEPRADGRHFCVALASMISKYLREVLMSEFNQFWRLHVPDLQPTAGYPGDAARFYDAIQPAAKKLGISRECLWRQR